MKGLKVASAIALLSFMVISQKANAQTLPGIDIKPEIKPQIQRLQVESTPNPNSRQNDEKAQAYFEKGMKLVEADKYPEAIQAFSEVIKIQPNNQYAYLLRGYSYIQLEKYTLAKADLDKTIELDNSIAYAYYFRGFTNYELGNKNNAITDFQTAAKLFDKEGRTEQAQKSRELIEYIRNA